MGGGRARKIDRGMGRHGAPKGIPYGHPALTAFGLGFWVDFDVCVIGKWADVVIDPYGVFFGGTITIIGTLN